VSNEIVGYRNRWDDPRYRGTFTVSEDPCHKDDGTSDPLVLKSSLDTAIARVKELEAKLAEAGRDAGRLDYIERTFSGMTNRERYLPVTMIWGKGCNGRTLREACDKYMKRDAGIDAEGGDDVVR